MSDRVRDPGPMRLPEDVGDPAGGWLDETGGPVSLACHCRFHGGVIMSQQGLLMVMSMSRAKMAKPS